MALSDISGRLADWDSEAITGLSDGALLAAWPDSSGNNYVTEQPFNVKPTYETNEMNGKPVVRFGQGGDKALRASAPSGQPAVTVATVIRMSITPTAADGRIYSGDNGALALRTEAGGKISLVRIGAAILVTTPEALQAGQTYVVIGTFSASSSAALHVNGVQVASATHALTAVAGTYTYLGGSGVFGGLPFIGDIGRLAIWPRVLSSAEIASVNSDLTAQFLGGGPPPGTNYTSTPSDIATASDAIRLFHPPATVTATFTDPGQVVVSWSKMAGAAYYEVEKDGVVIAPNVTTTTFSDTSVSPGSTYSYRVRSVINR